MMKFPRRVGSALVRECMAEFLGTFILVHFGLATAAQVKTSRETKGIFLSGNFAFPVGVLAAMHLTKGISGAHLNPAVTLSFCFLGRVPLRKLLPYSISQILGAYVAAAVVYLVYYDAIMEFSGGVLTVYGPNETASIFAPNPSDYVTVGRLFFDQVVGTALLLLCILGLAEKRNAPAPDDLIPAVVAVVVFGLSISMTGNSGGAINPARDLGPRLFTFTAGWGTEVFTCYDYWFWIPLVAPNVGGVAGSIIYLVFIQWQLPDPDPPKDTSSLYSISDKLKPPATTWEKGDEMKVERF
ncbi:aquaporin-10a [Stegastes partitus]|nr:PREDICTED: aquaporin-10-like [Stegastes partitus]